MDIKDSWYQDVLAGIASISKQVTLKNEGVFVLVECSAKVYLNLVSLSTALHPSALIELQTRYEQEDKLLVHLWEDVWQFNSVGVLSRIRSFLNLNQTLHGRKTKVIALDVAQSSDFFTRYHLQGYIKAKYSYGLAMGHEVVAAASFSGRRPMKSKGINYYSAELVRFTSKTGVTVVGGLGKLIKHHAKQVEINDIMTYADRDWSLGKGYQQLGLELTTTTPPSDLYIDLLTGQRCFPHRLPKEILSAFDAQKE